MVFSHCCRVKEICITINLKIYLSKVLFEKKEITKEQPELLVILDILGNSVKRPGNVCEMGDEAIIPQGGRLRPLNC